jgi:RimJ/RimL family protein N-acetyltransferase
MHGRAWWQGRHTGVVRIAPPTLSDGTFAVRPLREADIPAIVAACQDPEIPRWTRVPSPYTREDARQFLAIVATEAAAGEGCALAVTDGDDRFLGTVGVMGVHDGRGEIGYWIAKEARGRGAATHAVRLLRDWAHTELGLHTIDLRPHKDNVPSQRVAERAGFTDTGEISRVPFMPAGRQDGFMVFRWTA